MGEHPLSIDLGPGELAAKFEIKGVELKTTFNLQKFLDKVFDWNISIPSEIMRAIQHTFDFLQEHMLSAIISKLLAPFIPPNLVGNIDLVKLMDLGEKFGKGMKEVISLFMEIIQRAILEILDIFKFFADIWKNVEKFVNDAAHKTKDWFEKDFADFWKNDARDFFENYVGGFFKNDVGGFLEDIGEAVGGAVGGAVEELF